MEYGNRPVQVQLAKSSKSKCKKCKKIILKNQLRAKVVDDRQFDAYVRKNGGYGVFQGQGMYRGGYIQDQKGVISVKRYFVHMKCYKPIRPHPIQQEYFRFSGKTNDRKIFKEWFASKGQNKKNKEEDKAEDEDNINDNDKKNEENIKKVETKTKTKANNKNSKVSKNKKQIKSVFSKIIKTKKISKK